MTPNEILTASKKRVKNTSNAIDWNLFFEIAINRIFSGNNGYVWRFSRQSLNFIVTGGIAEYTFDTTPTEKALKHIETLQCTSSYAIGGGGIPVPTAGSAYEVGYLELQEFRQRYPDNITPGTIEKFTIAVMPDGTNGMEIVFAPLPSEDTAVWIDGDFRPSYVIDDNPLPILPLDFHWIVIDAVAMLAAEEMGKNFLSVKLDRRVKEGMNEMEIWDRKNSKYKPRMTGGRNDRFPLMKKGLLPPSFDWRDR